MNIQPMIVNLKMIAYLELLGKIEKSFLSCKETLASHQIILTHPSLTPSFSAQLLILLNKLYPEQTKRTKSARLFFEHLILINYHIGNVHQLSNILPNNQYISDIKSVQITVEDLYVLSSFPKGL